MRPDPEALAVEPVPGLAIEQPRRAWMRWAFVFALAYVFLCCVQGLGRGLGQSSAAASLLSAGSSPWPSLLWGVMLVSALQSSALASAFVVAAAGTVWPVLSVQQAIGLILGVNIGAALSGGLAALAHMGRAGEFQRAFSAATAHGVGALAVAAVAWPLELATRTLQTTTAVAVGRITWLDQELGFNPLPTLCHVGSSALERLSLSLTGAADAGVVLTLVSAAGMISSFCIARQILAGLTARRTKLYLQRALDAGTFAGVLTGAVSAVSLQSARRTTSVLVPMAGAGLVSGRQVLPIALGANLGIAFSGVVSALAVADRGLPLALQVALVHLLFNALCAALICPWPKLGAALVAVAQVLAERAVRSKRAAFLWVALACYAAPIALWVVSW